MRITNGIELGLDWVQYLPPVGPREMNQFKWLCFMPINFLNELRTQTSNALGGGGVQGQVEGSG